MCEVCGRKVVASYNNRSRFMGRGVSRRAQGTPPRGSRALGKDAGVQAELEGPPPLGGRSGPRRRYHGPRGASATKEPPKGQANTTREPIVIVQPSQSFSATGMTTTHALGALSLLTDE